MEHLNFDKDKYVFASQPSMLLIGDLSEVNRKRQITLFLNELNIYNILLKDLVNISIKDHDRNICLNIAYYIVSDDELRERTIKKKELPISKLSRLTKIRSEYLERYSDYIITYYIILTNPNYKCIQDYFRIKLRDSNSIINISKKKQEQYKGLVVKSTRNSSFIITSDGEFIKIKTDGKAELGNISEGKRKKTIQNYRIHISILLVIIIFIVSGIIIEYRRTESIVVIQTTSNIKLNVNKFNKVIYAYSPTDKGKELVENTEVLNKDIDDAMITIFDYALNNNMLDLSKKTLITINGEAIEYGVLSRTEEYIYEKNIPIMINNAGNQQKLPKHISVEEENETAK